MKTKVPYITNLRAFLFSLAIFFTILPKVYDSYNDQCLQIYFYCLSASLLGVIGVRSILKDRVHFLKITIIDLIVASLIGFVVIYQILIADFFDLRVLSRYLACMIIFVSGRMQGKEKTIVLFNILVFYGLFEVFIVLLEVFKIYSLYPDSVHPINGTFGNPNIVAIFLALLVPIAILRYREANNGRLIYLLSAFLLIFTIVVCKCRSAIIFLIFLIIVYAISGLFRINRQRLVLIAIFISALLISLFVLWESKKDSNTSRELIWKVSWKMIREKPILGYGLTNFEKEYNLYQSNYLKSQTVSFDELYATGYIRQPYNEFMYFWLTGGIVYLLIYLSLWGLSVCYLFKSFREKGNYVLFTSSVSLVALFLISLITYTVYVPVIELFLFLHLGIIAARAQPIKDVVANKKASVLFWAVIVLFVGTYSLKQIFADYRVSKTIKSSPPSVQVKVFEKYISINRTNPQYLFNYALSLIKEKRFGEAISKLELAKGYSSYYQVYYVAGVCYNLINKNDMAEENYLIATALCPSMFRPHYALYRLYLKENKMEEAISVANEIDRMPVKVKSPEIEKIKKEIHYFLNH